MGYIQSLQCQVASVASLFEKFVLYKGVIKVVKQAQTRSAPVIIGMNVLQELDELLLADVGPEYCNRVPANLESPGCCGK